MAPERTLRAAKWIDRESPPEFLEHKLAGELEQKDESYAPPFRLRADAFERGQARQSALVLHDLHLEPLYLDMPGARAAILEGICLGFATRLVRSPRTIWSAAFI